jgi:hypothetical protein
MGVGDGVFERAREVAVLARGAADGLIGDDLHVRRMRGRMVGYKRTAELVLPGQIAGHVAKLGGKILMNEKQMHGRGAARLLDDSQGGLPL